MSDHLTLRLAESSDFVSAPGSVTTFCQQHNLDRNKVAGILAQLDELLVRVRRLQVDPLTLTLAKLGDAITLDWTSSNLKLPKAETRPTTLNKLAEPVSTTTGPSRVRGTGYRWSDEPLLQVIHLERPHPREMLCGDMALIARRGPLLRLAVADGLGHGPAAREAAQVATRWLQQTQSERIEDAVLTAHEHSATTRGATLGIVDLDLRTQIVSATTIGNIRVGIYQSSGRVWSPCGTDAVLGHGRGSFHGKLDVRIEKFQLPPGAQILLFSDGLSNQLRLPFQRQPSIEELAAQLFASFVVSSDDATLLALSTSR